MTWNHKWTAPRFETANFYDPWDSLSDDWMSGTLVAPWLPCRNVRAQGHVDCYRLWVVHYRRWAWSTNCPEPELLSVHFSKWRTNENRDALLRLISLFHARQTVKCLLAQCWQHNCVHCLMKNLARPISVDRQAKTCDSCWILCQASIILRQLNHFRTDHHAHW